MILHGYWRSGAAYRVRIALALKGVAYEQVNHDLRTGAQAAAGYAALNPLKLVPALEIDGRVLTQSSAIIEWLDETHADPPLLPADPFGRASVRALVATIAGDTHPLHNLRVNKALRERFGADEAAVADWNRHWIATGLAAVEAAVRRDGRGFAYGDTPTMADCYTCPHSIPPTVSVWMWRPSRPWRRRSSARRPCPQSSPPIRRSSPMRTRHE